MDESTLFPGFGRPDDDRTKKPTRAPRAKAAKKASQAKASEAKATLPPPRPEDCVPVAPFVPVPILGHAHLAAPTLQIGRAHV